MPARRPLRLTRLARLWDYLLDSWAGRLAVLGLGGRSRRGFAAGLRAVKLHLEAVEERVTPDGRPLPLPFIFAGAGTGAPPQVKAYHADTGELAFERTPFEAGFAGGVRVAAGDVNGDAWPDLVAAAGPGGGPRVVVLDGKTGDPIAGPLGSFLAYDAGFTGGVYVASGDADGDGRADVITAAGPGGAPHVKVFSGADGHLLASFLAFDTAFRGGATIAAADFTGDGRVDLAVGAGPGGGPHVKVFDLQTQAPIPGPLGGFMAFDPAFTGGVDVSTDWKAGDVTGDGVPDLVVGAGAGGAPHVKVFDGMTGAEARSFLAFDPAMTAGVRVATAFVDDDEYADVVVGTGAGPTATVKVFSGLSGSELPAPMSPYTPFGPAFAGGVYLAASNDPPPPFSTQTGVSASPSTVSRGGTLTLTASVGWFQNPPPPPTPSGGPTGTVAFSVQLLSGGGGPAVTFATAPLAGTGGTGAAATVTLNPLTWAAGTYLVKGSYSGDGQYGTSMNATTVFVNSASLSTPADREGPPSTGCTGVGPAAGPCSGTMVGQAPGAGMTGGVANANGVRDDGLVSATLAAGTGVSGGAGGAIPDSRFFNAGVGWTNGTGYTDNTYRWLAAGSGTVVCSVPRLVAKTGAVSLVSGAGASQWFDGSDAAGYTTPFGDAAALVHDGTAGRYRVTDGGGAVLEFYDFGAGTPTGRKGQLTQYTDAAGNVTQVTSWDSSGRPTEVQATDGASGAVDSVVTTYTSDGNVDTVTRRQKASGGSFATLRTLSFSYGTVSGLSDKVLTGTTLQDGSGNTLEETYDRWYASGASTGYAGGLKYQLGPQATARLKQAYSGSALSTLSDAQVAAYADGYYEYDPTSHRVSKAVTAASGCSACSGGQGTLSVYYATNGTAGSGVNDWVGKVATVADDGTVRVVYANGKGQPLLTLVTDAATGTVWRTYTKYGSDGQVVLQAAPSAVTGYSESLSDLVGWSGSSATYLSGSTGLITTYTYGSSTTATTSSAGDVAGYLKTVSLSQGTGGTAVPQSDTTYIGRTAGGVTRYHVASQTRYRNDNGTGGETTSYAYTWQGSTAQVASVTTTLPTVTTAENGPNSAATMTTVYDAEGRVSWTKDAAGVLSYTAYDAVTGAVVKTIADVNTANTGDFANLPSGWSTPSGGGTHLITQYEVDSLGRTTKTTDPLGHVTYTTYNDVTKEVRVYAGWDTGTNAPTGPTQVCRDDWANNYTETLTMSATPTVSGGRPTGTESVSGIQSLARTYRNAAGQDVTSDTYYDLTGVTYSTAANIGTQNTNYLRTERAYDKQGRPNKAVSAAGTITRTERDALGRVVSTWVGTDDTPTSGFWSTTNLTGTNMVQVSAAEYDDGGSGDGNLTKVTAYPHDGTANRVTQMWYDWRDRPVATKQGVESSESTSVNRPLAYAEYDNLGETTYSEVYDGDTVSLSDSNGDGVPDRPSSSLLRAKTIRIYDELGRVYQSQSYSVDPVTGSVSTYALTAQVWFDLRGLILKTLSPGGMVAKTAYDTLGRATTTYVTDGGGDSGWSDAGTVTGDTVLSQTEMTYDANGNVLLTTTRDRMHDASGTGALGTPSSGVTARVSYSAAYYDLADRVTDSVDVGTNGGSAWTRPSSVPSRSDTALVSSVVYDAAGRTWKTTDPRGIESRATYDLAGRTVKTIEDYVDGTVSDTDDKTTEYQYGPAGLTKLTADLTGGGVQTTEWVYGVSQTGSGASDLDSNDVVGKTRWPDPSTGASSSSQQETVLVNALGQPLMTTDRNGTAHTLTYDALGRVVSDAVTTLGSGVDGGVRRVETAYDGQGNAYLVTNYDAASGGSIVTQVQRVFNGLGQLTAEYQSHSGAVNTSTTPAVQYAYSTLDSSNKSRFTSMTYPSGYALTYDYSSGINDGVSRLSSLSDSSGTVESYDYLGVGTAVRRAHPQPGVDLTYVKQSGESNADAGDQYIGLDRFGRVADQRWRTSSADLERTQYGYDRDGNRTARTNTVNSTFTESYSYDGLNQLSTFSRNSGAHTQSWDYDAVGNWDSVTTDSSTQTRTANKQNEVTGVSGAITPTYDANGNMTTDETGKQYVYDAWNRLKIVKNSSGTTLKAYTYDGLNRRVAETVSGTTTDLYYSAAWQVLEEAVSGTTEARYVWSPVYVDALVLRDRDADGNSGNGLEERLWAVQDANWNVVALVNGSGSVVERYAYDPFGKVMYLNASWGTLSGSGYGWQYLHQGGRLDATSGLYAFRMRNYSPMLGRWMNSDPIQYISSDINLYRYIGNSATSRADSLGLFDYNYEPNAIGNLDDMLRELRDIYNNSSGKGFYDRIGVKTSWDAVFGNNRFGSNTKGELNTRYIYTCRCGLIDMKHFMQMQLLSSMFGIGYAVAKGWNFEVSQEGTGSAFSPEDLTSNALGAYFGRLIKDISMVTRTDEWFDTLRSYLTKCAPVDWKKLSAADKTMIIKYYDVGMKDDVPTGEGRSHTRKNVGNNDLCDRLEVCKGAGVDTSFPFEVKNDIYIYGEVVK